jgi:periplasmic divalent cation tolerance protein
MENQHVVVLTTADSDDVALRIARGLVEQRLAACVNVIPRITSVYRWKGRIQEDEERLLVIKSARRLIPQVRSEIRRLHSYELPEVLVLPIQEGDPEYLAWLDSCLTSAGGPGAPGAD